jgi:hypothetical protein
MQSTRGRERKEGEVETRDYWESEGEDLIVLKAREGKRLE